MAEAKPFASLSSGLLARKGAAKPAMRPQAFGQMGVGLDDLGWNDMGHQHHGPAPHAAPQPEHVPSSIAALTPAPRLNGHSHAVEAPAPAPEPIAYEPPVPEPAAPPVVEQQRAVEAAFAQAPRPSAPAAAPRRSAAVGERTARGSGPKAAFTLRLDPERHLKLRLACAVEHRSAQQVVTEALDNFLASLPEVAAIASHVPGKANGKAK